MADSIAQLLLRDAYRKSKHHCRSCRRKLRSSSTQHMQTLRGDLHWLRVVREVDAASHRLGESGP